MFLLFEEPVFRDESVFLKSLQRLVLVRLSVSVNTALSSSYPFTEMSTSRVN